MSLLHDNAETIVGVGIPISHNVIELLCYQSKFKYISTII